MAQTLPLPPPCFPLAHTLPPPSRSLSFHSLRSNPHQKHTAQSTQVISLQWRSAGLRNPPKMENKKKKKKKRKVRWGLREAEAMVLTNDRMCDCVQAGCFLDACQVPAAAALQHVNMSVARETGRVRTATRSIENLIATLFPAPPLACSI